MKAKQWVNNNRMLFESEHKTFNAKTNCISTGNVIANTQNSTFIRGYENTSCNGQSWERGHLQAVDLKPWSHLLPSYVRKALIELASGTDSVILYMFKHRIGSKLVIHGFIVTDCNYNELKRFYINNNQKSYSVICEAAKYVTNYQEPISC